MLAEIGHNYVNWIDGMKISKEHFLELEDAVNDHLRDVRALQMTDSNYGLLPASLYTKHSLELRIHGEELELLTCRAITQEGVRIEITNPSTQKLTVAIQKDESKTNMYENAAVKEYDIVVVVNPYLRNPMGNPNPEESPPRHPNTTPMYSLHLVPSMPKNMARHEIFNSYKGDELSQNRSLEHNQTNYLQNQNFNGSFLPVGVLRVENGRASIDETYIPPSTTMNCVCEPSISLEKKYIDLLNVLNIIKDNALHVLQKVNARAKKGKLDTTVHVFAERTVFFLADTMDEYRLLMKDESPLKVFTYFVRFANILYTTLSCQLQHERESFIDYISGWFQRKKSDLEYILRDSLSNRKYDHTDLKAMFGLIEQFAETVAAMYQKLVELHFRDYQPEPVYTPPPPEPEPEPKKPLITVGKEGKTIYKREWNK